MPIQNKPTFQLTSLLGEVTGWQFNNQCGRLLAEAHARRHNPIDGQYARVSRDQRLAMVAADLLVVCGLLRDVGAEQDGTRLFTLTELGDSAYERLERYCDSVA